MTDDRTPTKVAMYTHATRPSTRIAEFHWSPETGVTLTILDPKWGDLAQEYFDHGIPVGPQAHMVIPTDGPQFMRALLQPWNMSYYRLTDESDHD